MKKFILLTLLAILIASCSTDDVMIQEDNVAAAATTETAEEIASRPFGNFKDCFNITGTTDIDLSQGWGNPVVNFYATCSFIKTGLNYYASVEVQVLDDCEDVEGSASHYDLFIKDGIIYNTNTELIKISVPHADLPTNCWRWRYIIKGSRSGSTAVSCASVSDWYEAPLY